MYSWASGHEHDALSELGDRRPRPLVGHTLPQGTPAGPDMIADVEARCMSHEQIVKHLPDDTALKCTSGCLAPPPHRLNTTSSEPIGLGFVLR